MSSSWGSFAAVAAALALARGGRQVLLVEPRTYLGREVAATLRPWVSLAGVADLDGLPRLTQACIEASDTRDQRTAQEVPLHLDKVKLRLEDEVLDAGATLLYGSVPVAVDLPEWDDRLRRVVIGN